MKGVWDMKEILSGRICDLPTVDAGAHMLAGEKRIVFGPERFWDTHVMRCFTLKPGGMAANNIIHGFTGLYVSVVMENSRSMKKNMTLKQEHGYLFRQKHLILSGIHQKQKILSVYVPLL